MSIKCPKNDDTCVIKMNFHYDAEYCSTHQRWAIDTCDDFYCEFCGARPEFPPKEEERSSKDSPTAPGAS